MLHSEESGNGLPVILLHGFGEDLTLWQEIVPPLAASYRVITLDLPGFGQSPLPAAPFTLDEVAGNVHQHLQSAYQIKKYVVLGHSLGGYVSLALAELFPTAIAGLGLINSTAFADSEEKKGLRDKTVTFINQHGSAFFLRSFVPDLFAEKNRGTLASEVQKVFRMGENLPTKVLTAYMLAMRNRPDRTDVLKNLRHVFIAGGLHDRHVPYKDVESQINRLTDPHHGHIYQNVAHMSMYEARNELENDILMFLNEIKT